MLRKYIIGLWEHFSTDNLFRNSIYLMVSTGLMAALGFFFWLISTHLFTPSEIGLGTALISAMTLISSISLLGFNSTFIRILPNASDRNNQINTGSTLVISAAMIMAIGYVLLIPYLAPQLGLVHYNIWYAIGFVVMVGLASINSLTDSIFIAYRSAKYVLLTEGVYTSGTKLFLPLFFLSLGAYGVFASAGLAASIGMIASVFILMIKFNYRPRVRVDRSTLKAVFHYSFTNYIASLLSIAPTLILPVIIIDHLGAIPAANFYLAFMIINLLYTVASSVSSSLFAEGSRDEQSLKKLISQSTVILAGIMIPTALLIVFFGPFILGSFGKSYGQGGSAVITMLALASPFVAAYNIGTTLLKIRQQVYSLILISLIYAVLIIGLTTLWVNGGLIPVTTAWMVGNLVAAIGAFFCLFFYRTRSTPRNL